MAGGGAAFSQAIQGMEDSNSGEPVVKYGTGGRISGFATGGQLSDDGIRRFAFGGDTLGVMSNADYGGDFGGFDFGGGYSDTNEAIQDWQNTDYNYSSDTAGPMAGDSSLNSDKNTYVNNDTSTNSSTDALDAFLTLNNNFVDDTDDVVYTPGPVSTGLDEDISEIVITTDRPESTPTATETETDDISEIIITTDRPTRPPVTETDTVTWETETDTEEISEIIITTDRPTKPPVVTETDTDEISEIIITTDRPTRPPVTETDTDEISEIIITTDRPTKPPVTETDTDEISEIIITTDRPTQTPIITDTIVVTDTIIITLPPRTPPPTLPPKTPPPTLPPRTPPPTLPPRTPPPTLPPRTPPPTTTPEPTYSPYVPPARPVYKSQYRNYADPLTMFNASNYGRDPETSAGYNYATTPGNMGIAKLNQNLRSFADAQMAQTYPDGSPRGADMNAVLAEMRKNGLTATDLENARYGRTTGLNTPFSQYNQQRPTVRTFGGGIADLIKNLPK